MSFEDKKMQLNKAMIQTVVPAIEEIRKVKSYTIKPSLAEELSKRAKAEKRSASNYLEQILEEKFNIL